MNSSKLNIIDIRSNSQYQQGHINNAINIPYENLLYQPEKFLDKNKIYYIYCQYGTNSRFIKDKLLHLGYNIINISGGYNAYKNSSNL